MKTILALLLLALPTISPGQFFFGQQQASMSPLTTAAGGAATLQTNGLLVRYWIDENSGSTLEDDGLGTDIDLGIVFASGGPEDDMVWTNAGGNIALHSPSISGDQRASNAFTQTGKLYDNLHGSQTATIELVASVADFSASGGRLVHMADGDGANGDFAARGTGGTDDFEFAINTAADGEIFAIDSLDLDNLQSVRAVYHYVLDTTEGTAADRVKVYTNGVFMAGADTAPTQNTTLDLDATEGIWLLNRMSGSSYGRSSSGDLHFVAIYDQAFDSSRVSDHYDVLIASDDAP